ncbi:hypothetical protein ABH920_001846 [Catenulispora sp. EB89]|uniref:hypothetical protein n=1 Tax=Catenulispora sp. EB89 TaxID=3156257 RepID=UPI003516A263
MGDQKTPTIPMPSVPAGALWEISLAAYLRRRTDLPSLALKPLGLLDRYGEVAVGPDHMAFDGEDVPWDKAVRVIVRDVVEVVSDAAMAREAEKIRHMLPPVPGRKWVVDHAMALLGEFAAPRLTKARGGDVVSEVVYRGALGREKTLQAGVFAALVMATWPQVRQSLVTTARANGVDVYGENAHQEAVGSDDAPTIMLPAQSDPAQENLSASGASVMPPRQDLWTPAEPQPEG